MKGFFISLEGGEGAGKTSLMKALASHLEEKGYSVLMTREPGGTCLGESIRDLVLTANAQMKISAEAELLLFLAARAQHIREVIAPALLQQQIVLCDRFNDSTICYQGAARGLGIDYVKKLCEMVCGPTVPSLTLFLNVSPEIGLLRSMKIDKKHSSAGSLDRMEQESLSFHKKIQEAFHLLALQEPDRIRSIDANQSVGAVLEKAFYFVDQLL